MIATPKENAMTKILNAKLIAAAFVAASAATFFSMGSAEAGPAKLKHCLTNYRSATVHCCEAIVGQNLPFWMRETGRNCATSVTCSGKKPGGSVYAAAYVAAPKRKKTYCYIDFNPNYNQGGNQQQGQPEPQPQPQRPNTSIGLVRG
jgi:hypothetical protein